MTTTKSSNSGSCNPPAEVVDSGKVQTGAGFRILPAAPVETADRGVVRTGAGFKLLPAKSRIAG